VNCTPPPCRLFYQDHSRRLKLAGDGHSRSPAKSACLRRSRPMAVRSWITHHPEPTGLWKGSRPTGRRMGKQPLRIAGYATGWIVSGIVFTPFGRRNFMKNDPGSSVFSMAWERFRASPSLRTSPGSPLPKRAGREHIFRSSGRLRRRYLQGGC
jgi:hypothetical protein